MAFSRVLTNIVAVVALIFAIALPATSVQAQPFAPSPAPTSDGISIDQGVAYVLMLVALVLTYLIHAADLTCSF